MVKRYRSGSRSKSRSKSRRYRRYARKSRIGRSMSLTDRVYTYYRSTTPAGVTGSNAAKYGAIGFTLDTVPNYSEFTALYDEYKLLKATVFIWLQFPPSSGAFTTTAYSPVLFIARDRNTSTAPASTTEVTEYAGHKFRKLSDMKILRFSAVPNVMVNANGYTVKTEFSPWLNTSDATIYHYGFRYAIDYLPTGAAVNFLVKYKLAFRNPR